MAFFKEGEFEKALLAHKLSDELNSVVEIKGKNGKVTSTWRPLGSDEDNPTKIDRAAILAALGYAKDGTKADTEKWLKSLGLVRSDFSAENFAKLLADPGLLINDMGHLKGFFIGKDGKKEFTLEHGSEVQILGEYDANGKLINLCIKAFGNDMVGSNDIPEFDGIADGTVGKQVEYALYAVSLIARNNSIDAENIIFTGYSLGGAFTNSFHNLKETLAGGFFSKSTFVGFVPNYVSSNEDGSIINFGVENDPVYALWGYGNRQNLNDFRDLTEEPIYKGAIGMILEAAASLMAKSVAPCLDIVGHLLADILKILPYPQANRLEGSNSKALDSVKPEILSGPNNVVSYDIVYALTKDLRLAGLYLINNSVASLGWATHLISSFGNAIERIGTSVFQNQMDRDSVIIVSNIRAAFDMAANFSSTDKDKKGWRDFGGWLTSGIWVGDDPAATNDHLGKSAFLLGTIGRDLMHDGKSDDFFELYGEDDVAMLSTGNDTVHAGVGKDEVILEGFACDYKIFEKMGVLYLYSAKYGLKELHDVETLKFKGNWFANFFTTKDGQYKIDYANGKIVGTGWRIFGDTNYFVAASNVASNSADTLFGTDSVDTINGFFGNDLLMGLAGNDTIDGGDGNDHLWGGIGNDILMGRAGNDILDGEGHDDILDGGDGDNTLSGGAGNDTLVTAQGKDALDGGSGDDILKSGDGDDTLDGGIGFDTVYGENGNDTLLGDQGDDILLGGYGNDKLDGGSRDDTLWGDNGDPALDGGTDTLAGGSGNDKLFGEEGNDTLDGGSEDDKLDGGIGNDTLTGGSGNDIFFFGKGLGNDIVTDFNLNAFDKNNYEADVLQFDTSVFGSLDQLLAGVYTKQTGFWWWETTVVLKDKNGGTIELAGWNDANKFKEYANSHKDLFAFDDRLAA